MKSLFKLNFLAALSCLVLLGSCSDEEEDRPPTDSELIGSGIAWKLSTATANGISVVSLIDACTQDNLVTFFYEDDINPGVVDEGATKCEESDPQTVEFAWDYDESTNILTVDKEIIDIPGSGGEITVESVTSTQLVLSQNIEVPGFGNQEVLLTLVH